MTMQTIDPNRDVIAHADEFRDVLGRAPCLVKVDATGRRGSVGRRGSLNGDDLLDLLLLSLPVPKGLEEFLLGPFGDGFLSEPAQGVDHLPDLL